MTAEEALRHPFFRLSLTDPPPEASGDKSSTMPSASHSLLLTEVGTGQQQSTHQGASTSGIAANPQVSNSIQGAYYSTSGKGCGPQESLPGASASGTVLTAGLLGMEATSEANTSYLP
jgi:hypothetical protein